MLLLAATTDKLQLTTSTAANIDVHADYMDMNSSTFAINGGGRQNTAISSATTTDIVAAPGGSTIRNIKTLHIRNKHASLANIVTVIFDQNGTDYELHKTNLLAGDSLEYIEGIGFFVLASNVGTGTGGVTVVRNGADHTLASTTPTEVTGLSVATGTGTFVFNYYILYSSSLAATGVRFDVNYDGTVSNFVWNQMFVGLIATASDANADQDSVLAAAAVYNAFSSRAKGTAGRGTTISVDTVNLDMLMRIEGLMIVTVAGNLKLYHGCEDANNTTVKVGSSLILIQTA